MSDLALHPETSPKKILLIEKGNMSSTSMQLDQKADFQLLASTFVKIIHLIQKNSLLHSKVLLSMVTLFIQSLLFQGFFRPKLLPSGNFILVLKLSDSSIEPICLIPLFPVVFPVNGCMSPPWTRGVLIELQHHSVCWHKFKVNN